MVNNTLFIENCRRSHYITNNALMSYYVVQLQKTIMHGDTYMYPTSLSTYCYNMWLDFPKPANTHNVKECFSLPINSSINKPTNCHNITAKNWLVCFFWEVYQTSTGARVSIECHWLPCIGRHLAKNHHLTYSWCRLYGFSYILSHF